MEIIHVSRGSIKIRIDERELTIYGEAMLPKPPPEQSEYVVFENSIKHWDSPFENEPVDDVYRIKILKFIEKDFTSRNIKVIIE